MRGHCYSMLRSAFAEPRSDGYCHDSPWLRHTIRDLALLRLCDAFRGDAVPLLGASVHSRALPRLYRALLWPLHCSASHCYAFPLLGSDRMLLDSLRPCFATLRCALPRSAFAEPRARSLASPTLRPSLTFSDEPCLCFASRVVEMPRVAMPLHGIAHLSLSLPWRCSAFPCLCVAKPCRPMPKQLPALRFCAVPLRSRASPCSAFAL